MLAKRVGRLRGGERGSVALVVIVATVLAAVVATLVSQTISDGRSARFQQNREAAIAQAEQGLANAHAAISQGEEAADITLRGSGADGSWTVRSRKVGADRWELSALGRSGGAARGVTAALTRRSAGFAITEWTERPASQLRL
ncbi:MAG: hypothetical protein IT195_07090 [Microthrixaceae bacterium]|nr:hypothetical protein [Microthrixaceae bacterium]